MPFQPAEDHREDPFFRLLSDHAHDAFVQTDATDCVITWAGQAEQIFGWSREEAVGKRLVDLLIAPDFRATYQQEFSQFAETGDGTFFRERTVLPGVDRDGQTLSVEFSVFEPIELTDNAGQKSRVFSVLVRDARDREDPGSALGESRALYQTLVDNLPINLVLKDLSGRRVFANERYLKMRNMSLAELMGKTDTDFFPPELAEKYRRDDREVIEKGVVLHSTEPYFTFDNRESWIERVKAPVKDASGRVTGVQLLFWDVSDRIEVEEALNSERHLLSTLLDNIPDSIYFKDRESHFIRISKSMADKFDLPSTQVAIGKTDADIFTEEHAASARSDELKIMNTGVPMVGEIERETWPDKEDTFCSSTKMPLINEQGETVGTFGISRDVTRLRKTQDQLKAAKDAADAANQAKSDFLANMSHEIRTPMNGIIGMAELMAHTNLTIEQRDYLLTIKDSAGSLLRIINDILDFSKIEAGKLELESTTFSLRDCVGRTVRTLAVRASEKGLELACRIDPHLPDMVIGDPVRLRQVVVNLVGNAIKFTQSGEVLVQVNREKTDSDETVDAKIRDASTSHSDAIQLRVSVKDTGIGISAEKQKSVFDEFAQADISTTRQYGGTGLGLAIASRIVSLMQGTIWLESELGIGTTFHFTAAFGISEEESLRREEDLESLRDLPTIVVDDNDTNRQIFGEMLEAWNLNPTLVDSGPAALAEMHRACSVGEPYKLVLLDCMMPHMDGFALAECIHQSPLIDQLPIIMISSAARGDDAQRCRDMGIHRYLTKPVLQSDLFNSIVDAVTAAERLAISEPSGSQAFGTFKVDADDEVGEKESSQACESHEASTGSLRVLLAEDGLVNQRVAMGLLNREGHEVTLVENGLQAVEAVQRDTFDLVLMDLQMPEMDGIEACQKIRQSNASIASIPIVAMTAAAMEEDRERCLDAGMDAYISKPIDPERLRDTMDNALANRLREATGNPIQSAREPSSIGAGKPIDELTIVDLGSAAAKVPGGREALSVLTTVLIEECPILLDQMRSAVRTGDHQTLERAAHTLSGSAEVFQARRVVGVSRSLEQAASEQNANSSRELLAELETEVEMLIDRLRKL